MRAFQRGFSDASTECHSADPELFLIGIQFSFCAHFKNQHQSTISEPFSSVPVRSMRNLILLFWRNGCSTGMFYGRAMERPRRGVTSKLEGSRRQLEKPVRQLSNNTFDNMPLNEYRGH